MRLLLSGLLVLIFVFYQWVDQVPDQAQGAQAAEAFPGSALRIGLSADVDRQPVAGAEVKLIAWEGQQLAPELSSQSAADGSCLFDDLRAGTYSYRLRRLGESQQWEGQIRIPSGVQALATVFVSQLASSGG